MIISPSKKPLVFDVWELEMEGYVTKVVSMYRVHFGYIILVWIPVFKKYQLLDPKQY